MGEEIDRFRGVSTRRLPWFLLGAGVFMYFLLFTPRLASAFLRGDVTLCLLNAARMLRGQVMYKDFFQITFPGAELVYLGLFRLFGTRAWIPSAMLLVLGLSLTWISVVISRKVLQGLAVYLPGLLFLTLSFYKGLDASHHWYSVLAVMAAVAVTIERRTPARLAVAGMLCGLALFFTQSRGFVALLGFAVFLMWERHRNEQSWCALLKNEAYLAGIFLITVITTNAYFVWKAGLRRFFYCTVVFVLRYFPAHSPSDNLRVYLLSPPPLRVWRGLLWLLVYLLTHALVPFVYLLFFVRYRREARLQAEHPWDRLVLLNLTGLFLFTGVASAPSYFRLCVVSLPALILCVWLLSLPGRLEKVLGTLLWAFALVLVVVEPFKVQKHLSPYLDTPSGRITFSEPEVYDRYHWIRDQTRPSDFFYQADWADTYFPLGLINPTPLSFLTNTDYTRPEQVRVVVRSLEEKRVQLVLWSVGLDIPEEDPSAVDHLDPLRSFLRTDYHVVKTFVNGDQVWQRSE